jgi:hypothetical protein
MRDRELDRRQKYLDRANKRLRQAGALMRMAATDMDDASQSRYPEGASGNTVRQAETIIGKVLEHFPTATH